MGKLFIWFNRHSTIQKSRPRPNFLERIILMVSVQEFRLKSENQFRRHSAPLMVVRVRTCVDWDQIWEWELQFGTEERGEGQWVYGDAGIAWPRPQSPAPEPETGNLRPEPEGRDTRGRAQVTRWTGLYMRDVTMSQLHHRLFSIVGKRGCGLFVWNVYPDTKL